MIEDWENADEDEITKNFEKHEAKQVLGGKTRVGEEDEEEEKKGPATTVPKKKKDLTNKKQPQMEQEKDGGDSMFSRA